MISPATAAILVTPAKERKTKAEAVPKPTTPSLENRPWLEKASPSRGLPQSKDGSVAAKTESAMMNRTESPTMGIWIFFMLFTPDMLTRTIRERRNIAMAFDIVSVNSNPSGSWIAYM